jgi:hypothetical protein
MNKYTAVNILFFPFVFLFYGILIGVVGFYAGVYQYGFNLWHQKEFNYFWKLDL